MRPRSVLLACLLLPGCGGHGHHRAAHRAPPAGAPHARAVRGAPTLKPQEHLALLAGGGPRRPAPGLRAGDAELRPLQGVARDGAGRVVLVSGLHVWAVGADGRLRAISGVGRLGPPPSSGPGHGPGAETPTSMLTLRDGSVVLAPRHDRYVYRLAAGADHATLLGVVPLFPGPTNVTLTLAANGTLLAGSQLAWNGRRWVRHRAEGLAVGGHQSTDRDDGDKTQVATLLPDGTVAGFTTHDTANDLDTRPLLLGTGPTHAPSTIQGSFEGEEYAGWISRRRETITLPGASVEELHLGLEHPNGLAPDGDHDLLVSDADRVLTTRPGLGVPDVRGLWHGRVAVRAPRGTPLDVSLVGSDGRVLARARPVRATDGVTSVALAVPPGSGRADVRVAEADGRAVARTPAFAAPARLSVMTADRLLAQLAIRTESAFDGHLAHGVDRCAPRRADLVACRWVTVVSGHPSTQRTVLVRIGPEGYEVQGGRPSRARGKLPRPLYGSLEGGDFDELQARDGAGR